MVRRAEGDMLHSQFDVSSTVARGQNNVNRVIPIMLIVLGAMAVPAVGHAQDRSGSSTAEYAFGPDDIIQIISDEVH